MALTAAEGRLRSQKGAHESWARTENRSARTLPARLALMEKFGRQVDPDKKLLPAERAKRAQNARKALFNRSKRLKIVSQQNSNGWTSAGRKHTHLAQRSPPQPLGSDGGSSQNGKHSSLGTKADGQYIWPANL